MRIPKYLFTFALVLALAPLAARSQGSQTGSATERQGQSSPSAQPQNQPQTGTSGARQGNQPGSKAADEHRGAIRHGAEDHHFAMKVAQSGMAEVELAKLAQDKASDSEVKQFASKLEQDHTKANQELKEIAQKNNWDIPSQVSPVQQATKEKFSKLSGAEFDREFMREMLQNHRMAVTEFKWHSEHASNADLKQFASKTLPTLEQHLETAQELHAKLERGDSQQPASRGASSSRSGSTASPGSSGAYGSGSQPPRSSGSGQTSDSPSSTTGRE